MKEFASIQQQKILLAPLNWGLGHVFRSIAVLKRLQDQNNQLFIACDASQKEIFQRYLERVHFYELKGYSFQFSVDKSLVFANSLKIFSLQRQHYKDHDVCEKIVANEGIDLVISDHRYGFYSDKALSIFMTHQCQLPINNRVIQWLHHRLIHRKFQKVWILEDKTVRLAGKLATTDSLKLPFELIGLFSRFQDDIPVSKDKTVAIISGPSPYNHYLLSAVEKYATIQQEPIYCISNLTSSSNYIHIVPPEEQDAYIRSAKKIISHAGYTTLMDLHFLQTQEVLLIPSPNQLEQEYLASIHADKYQVVFNYELLTP